VIRALNPHRQMKSSRVVADWVRWYLYKHNIG
jgi:hypothetical protein